MKSKVAAVALYERFPIKECLFYLPAAWAIQILLLNYKCLPLSHPSDSSLYWLLGVVFVSRTMWNIFHFVSQQMFTTASRVVGDGFDFRGRHNTFSSKKCTVLCQRLNLQNSWPRLKITFFLRLSSAFKIISSIYFGQERKCWLFILHFSRNRTYVKTKTEFTECCQTR